MKLWITTVLIALMTVSIYPRLAKALNGNELLGFCTPAEKIIWYNTGLCDGIIQGAAEGYLLGFTTAGGQRSWWCLPEGITTDQKKRVVVKYLEEHPEDLHWFAEFLVIRAFVEAWPCD